MKRSAVVASTLFAVLCAALLLLADPFAWFGSDRVSETPAPAEHRAPAPTPRAGEVETGEPVNPSGDARAETVERQVVDRLAEADLVRFRIAVATGRPVVGAQVLVVRDEQLLGDARTDAAGEVEFTADGRPAGLLLAIERRPLEWRDVALEVGRQEILLAEGGRVSARFVTEDGRSPGSLRIGIDSDHPFSSLGVLPPVVENAIAVPALLRAYAIVPTDEDGRLDLGGLSESWRGRLRLRDGFRVVSTSHGDILPQARGIRLPAPASGVVISIAPQPTLHGRLISRDDGSPLEGAQLATMLRSRDAPSPTFSNVVTDAEGHFEVDAPREPIASFELRLGGRFHDGPSILVLDGADVPADGDLGDVVVDDVWHVPFLVQTRSAEPIARAVAEAAGTRSAPTGKDGRGELRWVSRAVARMGVEAPGFVPAEREIPAVVVEPLLVTMEPANELAVSLRLPPGAKPGQFKVVLSGSERITAAPVADSFEQRRHVVEWTFPLLEFVLAHTPLDRYLCASPHAEGRVTFRALRPGVDIELRVCGITGDMVYHSEPVVPLAPAEHRELAVSLADGMIVFQGRVVDESGAPLSRAALQLGGQILGWTDDEGVFRCYLATPETGTLIVQHRACATRYVPDYVVPTHGRAIEFRLSAARPVTIEVVDANGAPVPQAEVWTRYRGFTTNTHRVEGHRHVAGSVPEEPFDIIARLAGREYRVEHDPALGEARIVVPVHGRVVARIPDASTAGRAGQFALVLVPPDLASAQPVSSHRDSTQGLRIEIPAVHPGTYQASIRYVPSEAERSAGREEVSSGTVPVVIEAGQETEVRLALPASGR